MFKARALYAITLFEIIGIKLPISKDSVRGFIQNQKQTLESDLKNFVEKERNLRDMIVQY